MPPTLLSSTYEIREKLGSGGGGVVYKAWHTHLQKDVVLKSLHAGAAASLDAQRAEVDILKNLKHSFLPQLYDFIQEGQEVYTVIEFIPGQSLDKLLREGQRFSQQQIVKWAGQLCEALCYLHAQKPPILHSDIKPANVMLTPDDNICLIDFNIALMLGDEGVVAVGRSHGYASPEQYGPEDLALPMESTELVLETTELVPDETLLIEETEYDGKANTESLLHSGSVTDLLLEIDKHPAKPVPSPNRSYTSSAKKKMDVRSDVYSLGATLYHLLTGERPARAIDQVKPLVNFGVPFSEGIVFIIEKAMNPEPAQRFQSAEQMLRAIRNIHKLDRRWKLQTLKKDIAAILIIAMFAASGLCVFAGSRMMEQEKQDLYNSLVAQIEQAEPDRIEDLYAQADALFPGRIEAYHAKAVALATAGEYEACRNFIETSLATVHIAEDDEVSRAKLGDIYFIVANSYFEEEDYRNAAIYYREATANNQSNPEYFRDYAISMARIGDIATAQELLSQAEQMNLGDDSLDLLRGEIAYAKAEFSEAVVLFEKTIRSTRNETILYRAFRICDDAYKKQNDTSSEIKLLESAKAQLPVSRTNEILERLADAYARSGDYSKAVENFDELVRCGYKLFHIRQNLAILYHQSGDFGAAEKTLLEMQDDFPEDYHVPMRLALLYTDMQAQLPNEQRDYAQTKDCFDQAAVLYEKRKPGESDPEMQMLEEMISQLQQGGWFN